MRSLRKSARPNVIVWHNSYVRNSGSDPVGNRILFAFVEDEQPSHFSCMHNKFHTTKANGIISYNGNIFSYVDDSASSVCLHDMQLVLHLMNAQLRLQWGSHPNLPTWESCPEGAAGRRVSSGISRFHRPFISALLHTHLTSLTSALKTSINRIRSERAPEKQSNDTHKTPYDRLKRCREHKINTEASERVNVDVFTQNKLPCPQHSQTEFVSLCCAEVDMEVRRNARTGGNGRSPRRSLPTSSIVRRKSGSDPAGKTQFTLVGTSFSALATAPPRSPHCVNSNLSRNEPAKFSGLYQEHHQGEPGSIPVRVTGFSQVVIEPDDAVGQRVF
ncbi:hypothetical protein PR048_022279 [Dryococelus australis]|uniref:Uncharacterized protein n=1 Tax=Dryococelus australis TaxID=614101 RepID=A0ABQ9H0T3_9NEOP|nr:hypothetical protein PR048_022279 [Dryococelus australis]